MQTKELRSLAKEGAAIRVERLNAEVQRLTRTFGLTVVNNITGRSTTTHWTQTPEGRAKASLAQKRRWKKIKKQQNGIAAK
jgi:hypothetical protein